MAEVLRLADITQANTVDLLAGTIHLRTGGWSTQTTAQLARRALVTEVLNLYGKDTVANLTSGLVTIEKFIELGRRYQADPAYRDSIWLEVNADGEDPRRALVYGGKLQYRALAGMSPMLERGALFANLALDRHPLWEDTSATSDSIGTNVSCLGGHVDIDGGDRGCLWSAREKVTSRCLSPVKQARAVMLAYLSEISLVIFLCIPVP